MQTILHSTKHTPTYLCTNLLNMQYLSGSNMMATLMCLFLLLSLTTALPNPAPEGTELNTRQLPLFCFNGWTQVDFKGPHYEACCDYCCPINIDQLKSDLRSARVTVPFMNMILWSSKNYCEGPDSILITLGGERDLPEGAEYYFMSPQLL